MQDLLFLCQSVRMATECLSNRSLLTNIGDRLLKQSQILATDCFNENKYWGPIALTKTNIGDRLLEILLFTKTGCLRAVTSNSPPPEKSNVASL